MEIVIQQFLREHRAALCALIEQQAGGVNGYYATLLPATRHHLGERYTDLLSEALLRGYTDRPQVQALLAELATHGILLSEFQAQAARCAAALGVYLQQELVDDPEVRHLLLTRLQQGYGSLLTKLTASRIDQHFPQAAALREATRSGNRAL